MPTRERKSRTEMETDSIQGPHGREERYETKEQSLGVRSQEKEKPKPKLLHRINNNNWS